MSRIDGSGRSIPPQSINSSDSVQNTEATKTANTTETTSNNPSERKTALNTRAVAEHKLAGNLQQMKLNSQFNVIPLKGGVEPKPPQNFNNGYPIKWQGPDFDADKNQIRTESLEIAHVGLKPTNEKIEYPNISFYTPEPGDTLQSIAAKFGTTVEALAKANNLDPEASPRPLPRTRYIVPQNDHQ